MGVLAPILLTCSISIMVRIETFGGHRHSSIINAASLLESPPRRSCRTQTRGSPTSCAMRRSVFSHPTSILLAICSIALTFVQTSQSSKQSAHWKQVPNGIEPRTGFRDHRSNGCIGNMSARSLCTPVWLVCGWWLICICRGP